jgi:SAP domain-containing new25/Domain of unknown function (DUF6434)
MTVEDFRAYYWLMADLTSFAKRLDVPTRGRKPELRARIERCLSALPDRPKPDHTRSGGPRDSEKPLRRNIPVVNYKSDDRTRAFFKSQTGPDFHFTYCLNQFRLGNKNLTYGDLVDEWLAERERRKDQLYKPVIASHGEYNRYIRDFFADKHNKGKSLRDAAASWNARKNSRGDRRYQPWKERKHV